MYNISVRVGAMAIAALAMLMVCDSASMAQDAKGVRRVGIPHREHGYGSFESQVITSQEQFDAFLKKVAKDTGWNKRDEFLAAFKKTKVDFGAEALVLIRQTEGSGSNQVKFAPTELKDKTLVCTIERKAAEIGTADIADYCLALVVPTKQVTLVEVMVDKKKRESLKVAAK